MAMPISKSDVLNEFKITLAQFERADSEDKDQMLHYLEQLMDIFGIESSDGLLNKWRYGFDPKQSLASRKEDAITKMDVNERKLLMKIKAIPAEAALSELTRLLGMPAMRNETVTTWFLSTDQSTAISLGVEESQKIIIWLRAGRFAYSRKL